MACLSEFLDYEEDQLQPRPKLRSTCTQVHKTPMKILAKTNNILAAHRADNTAKVTRTNISYAQLRAVEHFIEAMKARPRGREPKYIETATEILEAPGQPFITLKKDGPPLSREWQRFDIGTERDHNGI